MSKNFQLVAYSLAFFGVLSFFNFSRTHYLPMGFIFELCWFFLLGTIIAFPVKKEFVLIALMVSVYTILFLLNSAFRGVHVLDILLAIKPLIYIIALFLYRGHNLSFQAYQKVSYIFLGIFLIKYSISVGFNLNLRPLVFRENNFELLFLLSFLIPDLVVFKNVPKIKLVTFIVIFILSGSKSGILMLGFFVFSLFVLRLRPTWLSGFAYAFSPIFGLILLTLVFDVNTSVDRLAMAKVFILEVGEREWVDLLLGTLYLKPLSAMSCSMLHFYPGLFSYADDGTCFPLILHLAHLRIILDHSVLLFILFFLSLVVILKSTALGWHAIFIIVSPVILNGLSVSSYYSPYFLIYMFIIISTQRTYNGKISA